MVLYAKLKLHKITPNTQGIRRYDVMISGEVQSLALPLILRYVEQNLTNMRSMGAVRSHPITGSAEPAEGLMNHLNIALDLYLIVTNREMFIAIHHPTMHSELLEVCDNV